MIWLEGRVKRPSQSDFRQDRGYSMQALAQISPGKSSNFTLVRQVTAVQALLFAGVPIEEVVPFHWVSTRFRLPTLSTFFVSG